MEDNKFIPDVYWIKQNRHLKESSGYIEGRSILIVAPELLLKLYFGCGENINSRGQDKKERFTHTEIIGIWKSDDGTTSLPTKKGIIHYSQKNGAHIVPSRPENYIAKENL